MWMTWRAITNPCVGGQLVSLEFLPCVCIAFWLFGLTRESSFRSDIFLSLHATTGSFLMKKQTFSRALLGTSSVLALSAAAFITGAAPAQAQIQKGVYAG